MGNVETKTTTLEEFNYNIRTIASRYIFQQSFKDLTNLKQDSYCNKLTILTSLYGFFFLLLIIFNIKYY